MSRWLAIAWMVGLIGVAWAAETLQTVDWGTQQPGKGFTVEPALSGAEFPRARVTLPTGTAGAITVLTIHDPGISKPAYAVNGRVRYENVGGDGYLEMWNLFPDGSRYFTRTLASQGPMAKLHGTHDWRTFSLPFFTRGTNQHPGKLIVNVVLPQGGTVELGRMQLIQFQPGEDILSRPGQWWPGWVGGVVGGLLGGLLGLLGALVGVLSSTGRHRGLVLGLMTAAVVLGLALLAVGVAAVAAHQPYAVYYPLLLTGGLTAILFAALRPGVQRRYDEVELRRMSAQDASAPAENASSR